MLKTTKIEKFKAIDTIIKDSQPNNLFYTLLVLSSLIITSGILINNIPVIIGGMLVTPLLTPLLLIALGFSMGRPQLIIKTGKMLLKTIFGIVVGAFFMTLFFGSEVVFPFVSNSLHAGFIYFIIALSSGVAVTLAWIKEEISEIIPGIAITVSLVPPMAYIGVTLAKGDVEIMVSFLIILALNLLGVILGSIGVFSFAGFNGVQAMLDKELSEHEKEKRETEIID